MATVSPVTISEQAIATPVEKEVDTSPVKVKPLDLMAVKKSGEDTVGAIATQAPRQVIQTSEEVVGRVEKIVAYIKGGVMHVYTKVNGVVIHIQMEAVQTSDVLRTKAIEAIKLLTSIIEANKKKLVDGVLLIKAKVSNAGVYMKAKVLDGKSLVKTKALEYHAHANSAIQKIPVPRQIKDTFSYVYSRTSAAVVYMKGGFMTLYAKLEDAIVRVRVKCIENVDFARAKARAVLDRVQKAVEPYIAKIKGGVASLRGKVGDATVYIKTRVLAGRDATKAQALKSYRRLAELAMRLPLADKVTKGASIVASKGGDVVVYVKDGFVHVATKAGDTVVYIKGKVVEAEGVLKLKILETYMGTRTAMRSVVACMVARAVAVAETTKRRAIDVAEYSKSVAAEKPVASSAAGGAVLLGAGAGATGLVAGGVAGAACGVPFALFTLGLSIPFGAMIGGGAGACAGAVAGGTTGAIGGATVRYSVDHSSEIKDTFKSGVDGALAKASSLGILGKGLAKQVGGTGGTA